VTLVDWIALAIVVLAALAGWKRGLILSAFSLAGLALGAFVGSRVAPHLLSGGPDSIWTNVAALVGAVVGAGLIQVVAVVAGSYVRGGLRFKPLRTVDSLGGLVLGIVTGLAIVWVCAAVVLNKNQHGLVAFKSDVRHSWIVKRLDEALPFSQLDPIFHAIDPYPSVAGGPSAPPLPPSVGVVRNPRIRAALPSVVKVLGSACGKGVEGSGWFARRDLVVTAAHVVAGEDRTYVEIPGHSGQYGATVVVFDVHNDIAVLRISGATARPLPLLDPVDGASVAIAGYPLDGNLTAVPGRAGRTANVLTDDALGNPGVERAITAIAGRVQHGNSGGPVIDTHGAVEGTVFAAQPNAPKPSGYAVPASIVRSDLAAAGKHRVSTQSCPP
jgi:S1-C subfamily serine protease